MVKLLTFAELPEDVQKVVTNKHLDNLLEGVTRGAIRLFDNDTQAKVEAAWAEAEAMRTPWFAHEYIMDAIGDVLREIAEGLAENCYYLEEGESLMRFSYSA